MKKTIISTVFAAAMIVVTTSCAGGKSETSAGSENVVAEASETVAVETPAQDQGKAALIKSGLVSEADFEKPVFVDFTATWCGPCRQFKPYYEAAAEKYAGKAKFVTVDVDVYGDVANAYNVNGIPTVLVIVPGKETVRYEGIQNIVGDGVFDAIVDNATR